MRAIRPPRLLAEERRRKIVEAVEQDGRVTISDLVKRFGVSAVTARCDLDALTELGAIVRSHGGAVRRLEPVQDYPLMVKEALHHHEKVRIGRAAAELVRPNETIILDSGTTTMEVARAIKALKFPALTVITNALNIAMEFSDAQYISLLMTGGMLRHISYSFVGPQAEQMLRSLYADHLFLAVDGFDPEIGPSTPDILEAQLNAVMMRIARQVTVVADCSKFERRSLSVIGSVEEVHRVITDNGVNSDTVAALRRRGLEVLTV